jgi:hypothetical protein
MSPSTVEHAYELARAGAAPDVAALKVLLKADGCRAVDALLAAPSIQRHLQAICTACWSRPDQPAPPQPQDPGPDEGP